MKNTLKKVILFSLLALLSTSLFAHPMLYRPMPAPKTVVVREVVVNDSENKPEYHIADKRTFVYDAKKDTGLEGLSDEKIAEIHTSDKRVYIVK